MVRMAFSGTTRVLLSASACSAKARTPAWIRSLAFSVLGLNSRISRSSKASRSRMAGADPWGAVCIEVSDIVSLLGGGGGLVGPRGGLRLGAVGGDQLVEHGIVGQRLLDQVLGPGLAVQVGLQALQLLPGIQHQLQDADFFRHP